MVKKKKNTKKERKKQKEEKICEIFEVEKKGEEGKIKRVCDGIEKKHSTAQEIENQKKTLRNILIGIAIVIILIIGVVYFINSQRYFEYRGIGGSVVKEGNLIFYRVAFPVKSGNKIISYSIYIRNNPRKLDVIPFEGEMVDFKKLSVFSDGTFRLILNSSEFDCNKDEIIAIGNMLNLKALNIRVMKDDNASCDSLGRYIYVNIKEGEESKITQIGPACYELSVSNCEILKVTERFMVEAFVKYYEVYNLAWKP